ncbi:hypothetical protein IFM89_032582 [Coptis chinensis]|uniref:Uncharacterized protein n=1 Tax=Coptis chinensis TaxID=261450 RepID=A0A835MGA2_9MAGN|nr:hypothetical protein IFM89_032582 [Coptis chinensis]
MEVIVVPVSSTDFNFDSACSSPYISAPSSPKRFGEHYFSAPTSPSRVSVFYRDFNNFSFIDRSSSRGGNGSNSNSSVIPYDWEEKPGTPKGNNTERNEDDDDDDGGGVVDDFEFGFSGQLDRDSLTADELFDGGKIKPLKPPPRLQLSSNDYGTQKSSVSSPRSPRSPISQGKKMIREAFSPKQRKDVDPFAVAIEQSRQGVVLEQQRGRERVSVSVSSTSTSTSTKPTSNHKKTRSLSPFRTSSFENTKPNASNSKPTSSSSRKWSFKDLLLFRSASEGRASDRDPLRKYSVLSKRNEDVKNSSFRSTDSSGSGSGSIRRVPVSAHELHYKSNRAVSEEMKRKTYLPYKHGLLFGCLGSYPAVQGLAKGFHV